MRALTVKQKQILDRMPLHYITYDDLPPPIWDELCKINDSEILWSEVNRYLSDRYWKEMNNKPRF